MSKKKLEVTGIMNELQGASLFFTPATPVSTPPPPEKKEREQKIPAIQVSSKVEIPETPPENTNTAGSPISKKTIEPNNESTNERKNESTGQRIYEQPNERTNGRFKGRRKIRHTFDIFADQLMSLREITLEEERFTGDRVLLGDLAQQALDMFISKYRNK